MSAQKKLGKKFPPTFAKLPALPALLSTSTEDVDNQPRHLVGIREYSEELRPQPSFGSSFVGSLSFTSQAPQAPPSALQTAVRNGQAKFREIR